MIICKTETEMRRVVHGFKQRGTVGLVPTMGALHDGHVALIRAACDHVVVSIFVNPTQFGQAADLDNYPRTEAEDCALLEAEGVDAVFMPDVDTMYPAGDETIVETTRLANMLHGKVRPGHFRGVTTVVLKLFNLVQPDRAFFGEKDYQQLQVIRRMVRDLHVPVAITGVPTVREGDGLAMSSRNRRLSPADRAAAPVLNRALTAAAKDTTVEAMANTIRAVIGTEPRARLKGLDIVWASSFTEASGPITETAGIMISAEFGPDDDPILLIDQREIHP
ncbi:pantoate--beta-alanine ligase [Aliiroseovarius sp. PTFE2010]|uniref:pantoate--beta-alanine ligase n=1 Tax=Aliiroseovarius sp. PTFE2010 TaxID=3417190 RepID=UPI003CF7C6AA